MMIIKKEKLIKRIVGIMVFIMAMITVITNVNSQKTYANEISSEVDGIVDVQYTLKYEFEEHYKPGSSWTCEGEANGTSTFSVPVKVKITRDTNGKATYSMSFKETSDWRLECYAVASGMKPDQGSYIILVMLFIGGLAAYTFVWDLGDVGIGLMTIFNIIILYPQGEKALKELKEYEKEKRK